MNGETSPEFQDKFLLDSSETSISVEISDLLIHPKSRTRKTNQYLSIDLISNRRKEFNKISTNPTKGSIFLCKWNWILKAKTFAWLVLHITISLQELEVWKKFLLHLKLQKGNSSLRFDSLKQNFTCLPLKIYVCHRKKNLRSFFWHICFRGNLPPGTNLTASSLNRINHF